MGTITRVPRTLAGVRSSVTRSGIKLPDETRARVPRLTVGDDVPLHPALTDVPVATLTLAPVFDALGLLTGSETAGGAGLWSTAAGVTFAVPTAAAGVMDYLRARTDSEVQRIGWRHALLNTTALGLSMGSLLARGFRAKPTLLSTVMSAGSGAIVTYSSHLGGIMVYREGMRVDAARDPEVGGQMGGGQGQPMTAGATSQGVSGATGGPASGVVTGAADPATVTMAESPDSLVTAGPDDIETSALPGSEAGSAQSLVSEGPDDAETGALPGAEAPGSHGQKGGAHDAEQARMEDGEAPGSAGQQPGREGESTEAA